MLLQTSFGWHEEVRTKGVERVGVRVRSEPEGATIYRLGPDKRQDALGPAPLTDRVAYSVETVRKEPRTAALWVGTILDLGATILLARAAGQTTSLRDVESEDEFDFGFATSVSNSAKRSLYTAGAVYAGLATLTDVVTAIAHGTTGGSRYQRTVERPTYRYAAELDGYDRWVQSIRVPDRTRLAFNFAERRRAAAPPGGGSSGPHRADARAPLVAVMNVVVATSAGLDAALATSVTDQVRVFIGQRGHRTIDRGAQEAAFRGQVQSLKRQSYDACFDESCQIELGKALAATHILRARIARFGRLCVLNGELIDLRSEVAERAASVRGACEAEGFLDMSERLVGQLFAPSASP